MCFHFRWRWQSMYLYVISLFLCVRVLYSHFRDSQNGTGCTIMHRRITSFTCTSSLKSLTFRRTPPPHIHTHTHPIKKIIEWKIVSIRYFLYFLFSGPGWVRWGKENISTNKWWSTHRFTHVSWEVNIQYCLFCEWTWNDRLLTFFSFKYQ